MNRLQLTFVLSAFVLLFSATNTLARILNVPEDYQTIQAGIDAAEAGDTVLVQPGEYRERLRIVRSVILGSLTLTTENPAYLDSTTIDGQQQGTVIEATSADQNSVLLIRGFTIKNGQRPGYSGGIYIPRFGSVLLQDLLVTANAGTVPGEHPYGGGIEMGGRRQPNVGANSTITMERVRVIGNRSEYAGGGVAIFFVGLATLRDCIIADNDGGGYSGGIYPICNLIMSHVLIANNVAGNSGGAFHTYPGGGEERRFELDYVTIVGNRAGEYGAFEGGFDAGSSLTNSIVWGNVSTNGGSLEAVAAQINISFCDLEGGEDGIVGPRPNFEAILDSDPLFVDADNGDFTLTRFSPCVDAGDPNAELDPDGTRSDMGAFYLHQTFHCIPMHSGWNIISTFNQPRDAAVRSIWSEIVSRGNLTLAKDQSGRFYNPAIGAGGFSNMQPWDVRQGYMVRLVRTDTLVTLNVPVEVTTPIPLRQGWNICAYFPEEDLTAAEAFVNLGDDLVMVKDEVGRFCRPSIRFSNMGRLTRGKGYQINVARDVELVYNVQQGRMAEALISHDVIPTHFTASMTDRNMSIVVSSADPLQGELAAFTTDGRCVGSVATSGLPPYGLAIWGDDACTDVKDGAIEDEVLNFRYWDGAVKYPAGVKFTEGDGRYVTDGFAQMTISGFASQPIKWSLSEPYPNPFNSSTTIKFSLMENSKVRLTVFDLSGREVAALVNGELKAGNHSMTWNAEGFAAGLYVVKVEAGAFSASRKVTLIK